LLPAHRGVDHVPGNPVRQCSCKLAVLVKNVSFFPGLLPIALEGGEMLLLVVESARRTAHNQRFRSCIVLSMRPLSRQPETFDANPARGGSSEGPRDPIERHTDVTEVFRKLAAHGGGAVSFDLALDLVLNELVQLARDATGADGAAIALERDGQMVCRATTGGNAPDLGVRVETTSGLTGACLQAGETQLCSDTETDARVDAAACRQLGVRSMLIAPVTSGAQATGILEVFSSRADAFAAHDIDTVRGLARKIADSQKGIEKELLAPEPIAETSIAELMNPPSAAPPKVPDEALVPDLAGERPRPSRDVWTSVLVILVIVAAVALGLLIGWRQAAKNRTNAAPSGGGNSASVQRPAEDQPNAPRIADPSAGDTANVNSAAQTKTAAATSTGESGALVITENGKVIYRQVPAAPARATHNNAQGPRGQLIRRVEPQYPELAKNQGIQGTVVLDVQVLGDGQMGSIQVISGDPLLADAAVQAVKQWKYQPRSVDGRPAESHDRVTIRFTLPPG